MSDQPFKHLDCRSEDGILVITLTEAEVRGDELAAQIRAELSAAAKLHNPSKMVLDLNHVAFMSSTGFGALAAFRTEYLRPHQVKVALCGLSPFVRDTLRVLRFVTNSAFSPVITGEEVPAAAASTTTSPSKVKPLFEIVAANVPEAIQRLQSE